MGDFEADTLRDSIESGWALTGALAKTESVTVQNPVKFYAHSLVKHTEAKRAIIVRKLTPITTTQNHTEFREETNVYEIICRYTVDATNETAFDLSVQRVEDMCNETERLVKTVYEPQSATGGFFTTNLSWRNDDEIAKQSQVLVRTLTLTLKKLVGSSDEYFQGFDGILQYDTSGSEGDNKPASDYTYTSVYRARTTGGFTVHKEAVHGNSKIPKRFTGSFKGLFECELYAKKSDINGTTDEDLTKLGDLRTNGELNEVVFFKTAKNTESSVLTLTETIKVQIIDFTRLYDDQGLVEFRLIGDIVEQSTFAVA
jgi:hypothetical protein